MLRHGVATLMADRGYQAHDIARILRHADSGRLAQKTYMHPAAPDVSVVGELVTRRVATQQPNSNPTTSQTGSDVR